MTLSPFVSRNVTGLEGPEYPRLKVGPLCAAPGCSRIADHGHHMVRRSALGGDFAWVRVEGEGIFFNLCALCHICHLKVTDNKAHIKWSGTNFVWNDELRAGMLLDPQPPAWGIDLSKAANPEKSKDPVGPAAVEKCPECLRALPKMKTGEEREKKRVRKSWSIAVPMDEQENGADVLDTLLKACAELFSHDESRALRYFTITQALALVVQHGHLLVGDGEHN